MTINMEQFVYRQLINGEVLFGKFRGIINGI